MSRHFSKIGVWLFVLAVAWYLAANFMLKNVEKEQASHVKSTHVAKQLADIGNHDRAVIRTVDADMRGVQFDLVFDPGAKQATVINENVGLAVSTQFIDGVFNIGIGKEVAARDIYSGGRTTIRLPATVSKVEISGVNSVQVSGSLPAPSAELTLEFRNGVALVTIFDLLVNRLKLASACPNESNENQCSPGFSISGQLRVGTLEVAMQRGSLNHSGIGVPQETLLDIGSDVVITGRRDFLQSFRFGSGTR